jgi:hypothetical protein
MDLQNLFQETIIEQSLLPGHASDIWLVKTNAGEFVVRSSGVNDDVDAPFLWACRNLFGIELSRTFDLEYINDSIGLLTNLKVPKILNKLIIDDRQFVVVEKVSGTKFEFYFKPSETMEKFGESIALIHSHEFMDWGAPLGIRNSLEAFPSRLKEAIQMIAIRYYKNNKEIMNNLDYFIKQSERITSPKKAVYIMLDMDPRQFYINGDRICAILDTEAYVIGPSELDLVALECSMDENGARSFKKGYTSVIPFPELNLARETYRFLFCLLEIKGPSVNFNDWISKPHLFD